MPIPYTIDLALAGTPHVDDPKVFAEFLEIYNAFRLLAVGVDQYTDSGLLGLKMLLNVAQLTAQIEKLKGEVANLKEQLLINKPVGWEQPGPLGDTTPNTAVVTTLNASGAANVNSLTVVNNTNTQSLIVTNSTTTNTLVVGVGSTLASTTTSTFGANGASASGKITLPAAAIDAATTQVLANALRSLAITFGLGQ